MESTHTHSFCRLAGEILAVKQGEAFDCIKPVLSLFVDFAWYTDVDSAFVFAPPPGGGIGSGFEKFCLALRCKATAFD